ncbi:MAG: porin [Myxococcota bacterium]
MMSRFRPLFIYLSAAAALAVVPAQAAAQQTEQTTAEADLEEAAGVEYDEPRADEAEADDSGIVVSGNLTDEDGEETLGWTVEFYGYLRSQYTTIQNDPDLQLLGRNDGFTIADAKLGFLGYLDNGIGFEFEIDAGVFRGGDETQSAEGELVTRLEDGFLFYEPHRLIRASAGQFKAPFDIEELVSSADILFVERSVGNRGVRGVEGHNRAGLSQGRQVGLRLDSRPFYFMEDGLGVSYGLAATNGVRANRAFNDNDKLAYFGRVNVHWSDMIRVGAGAFHNDLTLGPPGDQLGEERTGFTADLSLSTHGVTLLANIIQVDIDSAPEVDEEPSRTARSYQAQIAYEEPFFGLQPAYRFAYYDAATDLSGAENLAREALTHHTIGLNYNAQSFPVRLMVNYTLTDEEERAIDNDRFDALVQLQW